MVSSTPRPHFIPGRDPVPIVQETGWAPGPVWTSGKSRPHLNSIPERPARSQSLYRLSYPAHETCLDRLRKTTNKHTHSVPVQIRIWSPPPNMSNALGYTNFLEKCTTILLVIVALLSLFIRNIFYCWFLPHRWQTMR